VISNSAEPKKAQGKSPKQGGRKAFPPPPEIGREGEEQRRKLVKLQKKLLDPGRHRRGKFQYASKNPHMGKEVRHQGERVDQKEEPNHDYLVLRKKASPRKGGRELDGFEATSPTS